MNIEEDYVSYEVAKLLKEKGFKGFTMFSYSSRGTTMCGHWENEIDWLPKCTLQMACKWLREVHKLFIEIEVGVCAFTYSVVDMANGNCVVRVGAVVGSFEDTLNTAIKDVLENLI